MKAVTALVARFYCPRLAGGRGGGLFHNRAVACKPHLHWAEEASGACSRAERTVDCVSLSVAGCCKIMFLQGLREFFTFPAQEELGRTISQLIHAFQTTEAREYPYSLVRPDSLGVRQLPHSESSGSKI